MALAVLVSVVGLQVVSVGLVVAFLLLAN